MPLQSENLVVLIGKLDELAVEMKGLSGALKATDQKAKWAKRAATVGIAVGIIGCMVGVIGLVAGWKANDTADQLAQSRREGQISSCVQSNLTTERIRAALIQGVSVVSQPNPNRTEAEQASIDRFVTEYTLRTNSALPYRDCTPRGIEIYYEHPPADPALSPPIITSSTTVTR